MESEKVGFIGGRGEESIASRSKMSFYWYGEDETLTVSRYTKGGDGSSKIHE